MPSPPLLPLPQQIITLSSDGSFESSSFAILRIPSAMPLPAFSIKSISAAPYSIEAFLSKYFIFSAVTTGQPSYSLTSGIFDIIFFQP